MKIPIGIYLCMHTHMNIIFINPIEPFVIGMSEKIHRFLYKETTLNHTIRQINQIAFAIRTSMNGSHLFFGYCVCDDTFSKKKKEERI